MTADNYFLSIISNIERSTLKEIGLTEDEKNALINILDKCSGELNGWGQDGIYFTIEIPWR